MQGFLGEKINFGGNTESKKKKQENLNILKLLLNTKAAAS